MKRTTISRSVLAGWALLLTSLLLPVPALAAFVYDVRINTASLAGSNGFIQFQFTPGGVAPAAEATVSLLDLEGGVVLASPLPDVEGDVSGSLPGPVVLGNGEALNVLYQAVRFGTHLAFTIGFDGAFITDDSAKVGSRFDLEFFDANDNLAPLPPPGGTGTPVTGPALVFDLTPGEVEPTLYVDGQVSEVPEPHPSLLLAGGLLVLALVARRRQARSLRSP
jgi:hypothetical protein